MARVEGGHMDIIIIYGGNGLADDLSLAATKRIHTVLKELEVNVKEHHLNFEDKTGEILKDIKASQGVVMATTVEWMGIGGRLQTFLDRCYHAGQKNVFAGKYLMSVALTQVSGECDANFYLQKAWDILGGREGISLYGRVEKFVDIETNQNITCIIDKKTEDFYRIINQKRQCLPNSMNSIPQSLDASHVAATAEKHNLFNQVVSDDTPLQQVLEQDPIKMKQRKDIEELSDLFNTKLQTESAVTGNTSNDYLNKLEQAYVGQDQDLHCTYHICLTDKPNSDMVLKVQNGKLMTYMGKEQMAQVVMEMDSSTLERIVTGKLTAQRGFLTGQLKAKGNFTLLYEFDHLFKLQK